MRPFTLVLPYYENGAMLDEQQRRWAALPAGLRAALHVIIVDDGSPRDPARPHLRDVGLASCRLFRTAVDVRWNWLFCRNLAMAHCRTSWALMTDMDHVVPAETWSRVMERDLVADHVYRLSRVDMPALTPDKPHPNTWILTVAMFDRIGGYDERFSGWYGTDAEFRDRVAQTARRIVLLDAVAIRYPRSVIADASTTRYARKQPEDRANVRRIRAERDRELNWRPKRLTFPWETVTC